MSELKNERINRIYYLDTLRVIACLSVIMIHSSGKYVLNGLGSCNFWIAHVLDSISRGGDQLFFMISGALFLDKNYDFSTKKIKNHIVKLITFFCFWSGLYCVTHQVILPMLKGESLEVSKILTAFITGPGHLWFIYAIIGLYLITPLLRLWVKDENKKQVEYFIILALVFTCIIPQIISLSSNFTNALAPINVILKGKLYLNHVGGYTVFYVLGWYMHNYDLRSHNKLIYILGAVGLTVTILGTYFISVIAGELILIYGYLYINVILQTLMVFQFVKTKLMDARNNNSDFISVISKHSLGIYALHALFIGCSNQVLSELKIDNAAICIPIVFLTSFGAALLVTYIFKKIPILKKVV